MGKKYKYIDSNVCIDDDEYAEWGDKEWDRIRVDIERYVPVECKTTKEFFGMAVMTMCSENGVNADSKKWDKQYKEALAYMLHPNGEGMDEYLDYVNDIGFERAPNYFRALQKQGFLEAKREHRRDVYRAKQYAIKMSKK